MESNHCDNNVQEDYKKGIAEAVDRNEMHQVCPTRICSLVPDRHHEISPMRRFSSGLMIAQQSTGLEDIHEEDNEEDGAHSALDHSLGTTFTVLPSHTTPPSKQNRVRNPFDAALIKRLHLPIFSPSVFKRVISPTQDTHQFSWTIDDLAKIRPAPIEEYQPQQYEQAVDSETELKAQEAIDHYFCNTHIVSSPWGPQAPRKTSSLSVETNGNYSSDKQTSLNGGDDDGEEAISADFSYSVCAKKDASAQTVLTLPPELPPVLESALKPYFTFSEDQHEGTDEANLSTSTLRRKLFFHEENQKMSMSPGRSSSFSMQVECKVISPTCSGFLLPTSSEILSPSAPVIHSRTYGTPHSGSKLISSPEVSPIGSVQQNKSVPRLSFHDRMMLMDKSTTFSPSVSPLGMVPIQHEDDRCPGQKYTHFLLPNSSSAVITLETSSPVKGEAESLNSTSAMITSETSTPVKGKCLPVCEDISMESLYFKQIQKKLKEFENTDNLIKEGDLTNLNSFSSHSTENSLSNGSNMHSQDTGYQTGSMSCNMTSINGGATSAFSSLISVSKNWNSMHLKSVVDKHVGLSNDDFGSGKYNVASKGSTVAPQDNSLWLPGSMHIVSSTPTKACDKGCD